MATVIGEPVKVGAVFAGPAVRPRWFDHRARRHDIAAITYQWRSRNGAAVLLHFAVSDGANLYELSFNQQSLEWRLEKSSGDAA
ncbi:MAG TPA: hypothetical protein PKM88_04130 [bacterium]|nr:hypothetical protein [bacterium]